MRILKRFFIFSLISSFVFSATFLQSCGGKKKTRHRLSVQGLLKLPAKKKPASLVVQDSQGALQLAGQKKNIKLKIEETASEGDCEMIDSHFRTIGSAQTDADGHFSFLVDDSQLVDTVNDQSDEKLTFYIRCVGTNSDGGQAAQMTTVSKTIDAAESAAPSGDLAQVTTSVDTTHTTETLLVYRGKGVDPLTITDSDTAPVLSHMDQLVEAIENAVKAVNQSKKTNLSGKTADSVIGRLEEEISFLNSGQPLSGGVSVLQAIHLVANADEKSDATTLSVILDALKEDSNLQNVNSKLFLGDSKAVLQLNNSLKVLATDSGFQALDDQSTEILVGALIRHVPDEITATLSADNFIRTVVHLADSLKTPAEGGKADLETLEGNLAPFLDPKLVASATTDSKELTVLTAAVDRLTSSDQDYSSAASFLAEGFAREKASFWGGFVNSEGNATSGIDNIVIFVEKTVDSFDTSPEGDGKITNATSVLNAIDSSKDYSSEDSTTLNRQATELSQQAVISFDPLSCKNTAGGDYCVDQDPRLQCGCDSDCDTRGDCCADQGATCGEKPLSNFLTQSGEDPKSSNFNDDGTEKTTTSSTSSASISSVKMGPESDSPDTFPTLSSGDSVTVDAAGNQLVVFQVSNAPQDASQTTDTCLMCSSDNSSFQELSCDNTLESSISVKSAGFEDINEFRSLCFTDRTASSSLVYFRVDYNDANGNEVATTDSVNFNLTVNNP